MPRVYTCARRAKRNVLESFGKILSVCSTQDVSCSKERTRDFFFFYLLHDPLFSPRNIIDNDDLFDDNLIT